LDLSITKTVLRIFVALVLSIGWVGLIPIFGMPFGGCDTYGHATSELGCSSWPEFVRGFGFVLIFIAIAPNRTWSQVLVMTLLAVLSILQEIKTNGFAFLQSADGFFHAIAQGLPIITGGLVAFGLYFGVRQVAHRRAKNDQLSDR